MSTDYATTIGVPMSEDLRAQIEAEAKKAEQNMAQWVRLAVREKLQRLQGAR